jgi:hypothetical protein
MTSTRLVSFSLRALLGAGVLWASGSVAGLAAMAAEAKARIGTAAYDRTAETLVVPLEGQAPSVALRRLAPRQYVAELPHSELARDEMQGQRLTSRHLAGWSLSESPKGDKVLLRLTLNEDVRPQVRVTAGRGMVVSFPGSGTAAAPRTAPARPIPSAAAERGVIARVADFFGGVLTPRQAAQPVNATVATPARTAVAKPVVAKPAAPRRATKPAAPAVARAARPASKPVAARTATRAVATFGVPRFDAAAGVLVIPVAGTLKTQRLAAVQLNQRWAYLDVAGAVPTFTGVRFGHPAAPAFERWVMAKRPGRDVTRFSFALSAGADVSVKSTPGALLVAVRPKVMQLGRAEAPKRPAVAAQAAPLLLAGRSLVARPYFDGTRYGLVVPYLGETPRFRWEQRGDRRAVLALKGRLNAVGVMHQRFKHHPVMAGWRLAPRTEPGVVELALDFSRSAEVVIVADPARRQLLLIPQPRLAAVEETPVASEGAKTVLADLERDPHSPVIYLPFNGAAPAYTIEQVSPTFAYVDFVQSRLAGEGVTFHAPEDRGQLNYWLCAERPKAGRVRLALSLNSAAAPRVFEDRDRRRLVVVLDPSQSATLVPGRTGPHAPAPWEGANPAAHHPGAKPRVDFGPRTLPSVDISHSAVPHMGISRNGGSRRRVS